MEATGKYRTRGFIGESNTRVIFGEFVCEKQLADFFIGNLSYHVFLLEFLCFEQWLCGRVHVVINYW